MTLRLPPTSACAAAARRPSPVPRARVRRCPARVARSRRRADRQGSAGQEAWRGMAVRRSPSCLAPPWLLTLRWIDVHRIVANYWSSAGRAGRRRSCCSTAQGAQRSAGQLLACPRCSSSAGRSGAWLLLWTASGHRYCAYTRDALLQRRAAATQLRQQSCAAAAGAAAAGARISAAVQPWPLIALLPPPPPAGLPPRTLLTPNPSPSQRLPRRC